MPTPLLQSFLEGQRLLQSFCHDEAAIEQVQTLARELAAIFRRDGKIVIFGNGGSACDAAHFAEEFTGRYRKDRRALPVIALTDPGHITCVGNDYGFEDIFSRGVQAFIKPGDAAIGLSTSGNSANVIKALDLACSQGALTVALLGKDGGKLKDRCDYQWIIPGSTADRIQELHMMILHIIIEGVERELFPENYS